ncbi:glycosyltransferase family A protein [Kitasatospora sp. NPDC004799]|uniref:glycosyltransferase family 2 protein n=1 Tax=Kitasatospora sp. NPDC004799 TaxID=3154460 RepID=UPI0033B40DA6
MALRRTAIPAARPWPRAPRPRSASPAQLSCPRSDTPAGEPRNPLTAAPAPTKETAPNPGPWEVVVDNRSSDDTVATALRWADRLPDLRVVAAPTRAGINHARNAGATAARGDVLVFCDADDTLAYAPDAVMRYHQREHLGPLVRQAYGYGNAHLMRDFRPHGLPAVTPAATARSWLQLLRRLPELTDREQAGRWCYDAAFRVGRLNGSIHYRVPCQ